MTADEIRALRNRAGLTQKQFAEILGVTRQAVINWEKGRAAPRAAQEAMMLQLKRRLEEADQNEKEELVSSLLKVGAAVAGEVALIKILEQLFSSTD